MQNVNFDLYQSYDQNTLKCLWEKFLSVIYNFTRPDFNSARNLVKNNKNFELSKNKKLKVKL